MQLRSRRRPLSSNPPPINARRQRGRQVVQAVAPVSVPPSVVADHALLSSGLSNCEGGDDSGSPLSSDVDPNDIDVSADHLTLAPVLPAEHHPEQILPHFAAHSSSHDGPIAMQELLGLSALGMEHQSDYGNQGIGIDNVLPAGGFQISHTWPTLDPPASTHQNDRTFEGMLSDWTYTNSMLPDSGSSDTQFLGSVEGGSSDNAQQTEVQAVLLSPPVHLEPVHLDPNHSQLRDTPLHSHTPADQQQASTTNISATMNQNRPTGLATLRAILQRPHTRSSHDALPSIANNSVAVQCPFEAHPAIVQEPLISNNSTLTCAVFLATVPSSSPNATPIYALDPNLLFHPHESHNITVREVVSSLRLRDTVAGRLLQSLCSNPSLWRIACSLKVLNITACFGDWCFPDSGFHECGLLSDHDSQVHSILPAIPSDFTNLMLRRQNVPVDRPIFALYVYPKDYLAIPGMLESSHSPETDVSESRISLPCFPNGPLTNDVPFLTIYSPQLVRRRIAVTHYLDTHFRQEGFDLHALITQTSLKSAYTHARQVLIIESIRTTLKTLRPPRMPCTGSCGSDIQESDIAQWAGLHPGTYGNIRTEIGRARAVSGCLSRRAHDERLVLDAAQRQREASLLSELQLLFAETMLPVDHEAHFDDTVQQTVAKMKMAQLNTKCTPFRKLSGFDKSTLILPFQSR
ncbi:hypothetical protein BJ138DRAFT_1104548 [Hygrophoropsis aurantiaca]|uniref:Uncharacterized protein n=1 Tax=Hygrophoropsis aurantiaca TaxID=72124 RepID=A0ACB8A1U9_9AGAM|nr:hypothetical protein BJ138DRAFT_1104548 [Hygrophoropsis aurantiaca]